MGRRLIRFEPMEPNEFRRPIDDGHGGDGYEWHGNSHGGDYDDDF